MKLSKVGVRVLFIAFLFLLPVVSYGQLITIAITANVTSVTDSTGVLSGSVLVGDIITGTYTYDTSMADSNPSSKVGLYNNYSSDTGISLEIGEYIFKTNSTDVDFRITTANNYNLLEDDGVTFFSYNNVIITNGVAFGYGDISWQLDDSMGTAISNDGLILDAPDLSQWDSNYLYIDCMRSGGFSISGIVTTAVLIPEPATFLLLTCGLWFTCCKSKK